MNIEEMVLEDRTQGKNTSADSELKDLRINRTYEVYPTPIFNNTYGPTSLLGAIPGYRAGRRI